MASKTSEDTKSTNEGWRLTQYEDVDELKKSGKISEAAMAIHTAVDSTNWSTTWVLILRN